MFAVFTAPDHARTRSLIAAILAVASVGFGFGLLMPLVSLRLEEMTGSALMVSLNGAAAALSTLIATPFIPRLLHFISGRALMIGGFLVVAVLTAIMPLLPDPWIWIGLRFVGGLLLTCGFVISESWINQIAPHEKRATILGIYAATLSGGFGGGAAVLALIGTAGALPFIVGAVIIASGALPLILLRGPGITPPDRGEAGPAALFAAAKTAPTALMAAIAFGALESILFTLTPVYGVRIGLSPETASLMVAAGALGGIALQVPLGWLADRHGRTRVLMAIAAAGVVGPLFIHLAGASLLLLYPVLFFYSGLVAGLYTVGLALIGERFTGGGMVAANAAFIFGYGLGSFGGTPVAGTAMDAFDPWGLLPALAALAALPLIVRGLRAMTAQRAS
jgi:MFS family permease